MTKIFQLPLMFPACLVWYSDCYEPGHNIETTVKPQRMQLCHMVHPHILFRSVEKQMSHTHSSSYWSSEI